jgi:hypothetical protein
MTRPPQRKRGQGQKSKPKQVRPRPNENADPKVGKSGAIPPITPNVNDSLVIQKLITTPAGALAVDSLVLNPQQSVPNLRLALLHVYLKATTQRQLGKATKRQLKNAKSALSQWTQVLKSLERVSTDGRDGLRMLWKATHWTTTRESGNQTNLLQFAGRSGWMSPRPSWHFSQPLTRRKISRPIVVHGRHGPFLTLALALFCEVDVFKKSEVESAVTNVHEKRLAPTSSY